MDIPAPFHFDFIILYSLFSHLKWGSASGLPDSISILLNLPLNHSNNPPSSLCHRRTGDIYIRPGIQRECYRQSGHSISVSIFEFPAFGSLHCLVPLQVLQGWLSES